MAPTGVARYAVKAAHDVINAIRGPTKRSSVVTTARDQGRSAELLARVLGQSGRGTCGSGAERMIGTREWGWPASSNGLIDHQKLKEARGRG